MEIGLQRLSHCPGPAETALWLILLGPDTLYLIEILWLDKSCVKNFERRQQTMSEKNVQLNEEVIKGQIKELVRGSVEETLNELLEKEVEQLTQAARYGRIASRLGYRRPLR